MPSTEKLRELLTEKLEELFQLDQPDLDFGFYRIMHAKAKEARNFIRADLVAIIEETFGKIDDENLSKLKAMHAMNIAVARQYGVCNPQEADPVKVANLAYEDFKNRAASEEAVYEYLLSFFSRYYETGDFVSRRYYARENKSRAATYAIPYNGEEVKLHWANADQYYIKSTDYFSNYTFDLRVPKANVDLLKDEKHEPLRVHFRIIGGTEGEHANVKVAANAKRSFILHATDPIQWEENGELIVHFEYRPDPKKIDQDNWNTKAVESILNHKDMREEYRIFLAATAPTAKNPQRTVLEKHIGQYTARNTMDYFIHKNLGDFLHRELDFYIKNEVMQLDDIGLISIDTASIGLPNDHLHDLEESITRTLVFQMKRIYALRRIAGKLIDFLAQLENFQKKLWLKKKFVVETNYCITLDRISEEFYAEIAANNAQREEWVKLFAINELKKTNGDLVGGASPGYSVPLKKKFLKANQNLVLDTKFFDKLFKERLLASIEHFDEQCDGLLIHSENFQALQFLQQRYKEQVQCIYIDPPYNTGNGGFVYKDSYQHSCWLTMIQNRVESVLPLGNEEARFFCSIDDTEQDNLAKLLKMIFSEEKFLGTITWEKRTKSQNTETSKKMLQSKTEYILPFAFSSGRQEFNLEKSGEKQYPLKDKKGEYRLQLMEEMSSEDIRGRETMKFPVLGIMPREGKQWKIGLDKVNELLDQKRIIIQEERPYIIYRPEDEEQDKFRPFWSHFFDKETYGTSESGLALLDKQLGFGKDFDTVKPLELVSKLLFHVTDYSATILDYFAGSGTTGHAAINLNREDGGNRKYILVEMAHYFDTVLKPRMKKVVYSSEWKEGKPANRTSGVSHCFKYIRLESYEDTLNNLRFNTTPSESELLNKEQNPALHEDYLLNYMLDVETQGSDSLLNIDAFAQPDQYQLNVKQAGSDTYVRQSIDLLETFNYLIGLRVDKIQATQRFKAQFKTVDDPDVPEEYEKKVVLSGKLQESADGPWSFRAVHGWVPKNPRSPNDGIRENVLIIWRNLTGDINKDNLVLDKWFRENRTNSRDFNFDILYVNGGNYLPIIKQDDEHWTVRLTEEEFAKCMWEGGVMVNG